MQLFLHDICFYKITTFFDNIYDCFDKKKTFRVKTVVSSIKKKIFVNNEYNINKISFLSKLFCALALNCF